MKKNVLLFAFLLGSYWATAQIIAIPDANFKAKLLEANTTNTIAINSNDESIQIDTNNNGEIEQSEAALVYKLFYSEASGVPFRTTNEVNTTTSNNISDLTGIEYFSNVRYLNVTNNLLSTLDLTSNTLLTTLYCGDNDLTSLNVSGLTELRSIFCDNNLLTTLNVSTNTNLRNLYCSQNSITQLNLSNLSQLARLDCNFNQITDLNLNAPTTLLTLNCYENLITSLDFQNYSALTSVDCGSNELTNLLFANNPSLEAVYCTGNNVTTLDFSSTAVTKLNCSNNPNLTFVNVKNGYNSPDYYTNFPFLLDIPSLQFGNAPLLNYICHDEYELGPIFVATQGLQNIPRSSYCTFTPGGDFNTITGTLKYECSGINSNVAHVHIQISDGVNSGSTFTDENGSYTFYVGTGNFTIQPQLINPSNFTITPENTVINFTETNTTQTADFCIEANGVNSNLSVLIIPLNIARPGFDSDYLIKVSNSGNQVESGMLVLNFPDSVTDVITASPMPAGQIENELTWNFSGLAPFSTTNFYYTLNLNAPTETPALNDGDVLSFQVNAINANNYSFDLDQPVVNSFDPNDKTCLEGSQIDVTEIGNYLHYVVRFQNTGSVAAENIVIKDVLNQKLNWNTVEIIGASHPFRSTLTQGNKLEFFFENIDLPPSSENEEASNGYVAFKVRPKNTVVLNDIITNRAEIYFDYNFPIITNTTATQVVLLSTETFDLNSAVSIAPNPTKDKIQVQLDVRVAIQSISMYNTLGQLVKEIPISTESTITIDVIEFNSGTYLISFETENGKVGKKFVKL